MQRRMAFRNERTLYRRKCDAPGHSEEIVSVFSPDNEQCVYDHKAWWGDSWDGITYGREIDFAKPFLPQLKALWREVPDIALLNINPVNSDYCSVTEGNKNCYLVIGGDFNENTLYSAFTFNSKECVDTYWVSKSELNYETVDCVQCSRLLYSRYCEGCYDSAFLFNCRNCHDCFGCVNLVNQSYHIFNVQYSKEEYAKKISEFRLDSFAEVQKLRERFKDFSLQYPRRYAHAIHTVRSIGDNLEETKNCQYCFDVFGGAEDCAHIWLAYSKVKNCMDCDHFGLQSENSCDNSTIYPGNKVFYSRFIFATHDAYYSYNCHNCAYIFGCVGLRNKQYCILNRQYTKEEYEKLVPRLIEHMNSHPFVDVKGRRYAFGEFFPIELSPFAYNETVVQEYFPLDRAQVEREGYRWRDPDKKSYTITKNGIDLPDTIEGITDSILDEVIGCAHQGNCTDQCTTAFRVIPQELEFYRRMRIPPPRLCSNCRHYARLKQRNPLKLWHRQCQCVGKASDKRHGTSDMGYTNTAIHFHGAGHCPNEFETSYAPERPEIVYCEACYQNEVV